MQNPLTPTVIDVPLSGDARVDAISHDTAFAPDTDGITRLSFSIAGENSTFPGGFTSSGIDFIPGFTPVPTRVADFLRAGVQAVGEIANIQFNEVDDEDDQFGVVRILSSTVTAPPGGVAFLPFSNEISGNILILDREIQRNQLSPTFLNALVLHELGHALGLVHPGANETILPDAMNGFEFTIMEAQFASAFFPEASFADLHPTSFGYFDILALQHIYGANTEPTTSNTTYSFDLGERHFTTIYDLGGNDTISITGTGRDVDINLTPGSFINVGTVINYFDDDRIVVGTRENTVYLTPETIIENVSTAGGNDRLIGNEVNNRLVGNDGNDTIDGAEGSDRLIGGDGADKLVGGLGADTLAGGGGDDTAEGGAGNDRIFAGSGDAGDDIFAGGAGSDLIASGAGDDLSIGDSAIASGLQDTTTNADGSDTLYGGAGNDTLIGGGWSDSNNNNRYDAGEALQTGTSGNVAYSGSGDDMLIGDGGADTLGGGLGNDTLSGGGGDDVFYGGKGSTDADDVFSGGAGDDVFFGGSGADIIDGDAGADEIFGGAGDDTLNGGTGADSLFGGGGDDLITGGSGADVFFFANNHGDDVITDFDALEDTLFLANAVTDFTDLASVQAAATETTVNGILGLLIDTGGGNSVFLQGVSSGDLTENSISL